MVTNNYGQKHCLLLITCAFLVIAISLIACTKQEPETAPSLTPIPSPPLVEEWYADGIIKAREYYGAENYGDFEIFWRNDEQNIYIGMKAKTSGWLSVAFQPGSRMKNADMVLCLVENGETVVSDLFSTGDFGPHFPDYELGGTQNILEYGGREDSEFTIVEFKRALDTGDEYDVAVSYGENKIIWAYSSSDDITKKHSKRGYGEITLNP